MSNRSLDWLDQAKHDLGHARNAAADKDYDWSCFSAHQAAEKAIKALFMHLGGEAWGHSLTAMFNDLGRRLQLNEEVISAAKRLDKHYIPARYPNGFDSGAPHDYYTAHEADQAIADAQRIYDLCCQSIR